MCEMLGWALQQGSRTASCFEMSHNGEVRKPEGPEANERPSQPYDAETRDTDPRRIGSGGKARPVATEL